MINYLLNPEPSTVADWGPVMVSAVVIRVKS